MIPINKFKNSENSLHISVNRRLLGTDSQFPHGFLDDSVYKTYFDEETGDSEHDLVFSPNVQYHNISPDNIHWSIMGTDSNFRGTVDHQSFAEIELLPGYNLQNSNFKVSYLQEGEVFFVKLICYLLEGYEVDSNNDFVPLEGSLEENRKILHLESNYVVYRGYPINTKSAIYINKNGILNRQVFYASPIEGDILSANSGDPNFVYDNRTPNHAANISLSDFVNSLYAPTANDGSTFWELSENGTAILKSQHSNGKTFEQKTFRKTKITLIDDELGMYSHGRGLDLSSISTLKKQNPANFNIDRKVSPSELLHEEARENRISQLPGFNAIDAPLVNPNLVTSTSPDSDSSGRNTKIYIPGRSSHTGNWEKPASEKVCGTSTFEASGTASTSVYDGHACTCASEMCFEIWAECDNCGAHYDACSAANWVGGETNDYQSGQYSYPAVFGSDPPEEPNTKYELNPWNQALTNDANLRKNCIKLPFSLWFGYCSQGLYDAYGNLLNGGTECYDGYYSCCVANHLQGKVYHNEYGETGCDD